MTVNNCIWPCRQFEFLIHKSCKNVLFHRHLHCEMRTSKQWRLQDWWLNYGLSTALIKVKFSDLFTSQFKHHVLLLSLQNGSNIWHVYSKSHRKQNNLALVPTVVPLSVQINIQHDDNMSRTDWLFVYSYGYGVQCLKWCFKMHSVVLVILSD